MDGLVQAALVLVLEPVFEADTKACFDELSHTARSWIGCGGGSGTSAS